MGVLLSIAAAFALQVDGPVVRSGPDRIGMIMIVGNVRTADRRILDVLYESQMCVAGPLPNAAKLLRAEIRLLMRFYTRFDLSAGRRPTLKVLPREGDSPFRDIEVRFPEKWLRKTR